jgi:hypothetical protein
VKGSSSWHCFKLGRVIEMSLLMYLLFWQRVMEQFTGTQQDLGNGTNIVASFVTL